MKRRFSCREISLIDQMIQTIVRDLFLPERLEDDARSIGWCTFLHTYQKYPAQFLCLCGRAARRTYGGRRCLGQVGKAEG